MSNAEYIIKIQKGIFGLGHLPCVDEYTRKLAVGEIEFSEPILNQVFDKDILTYTVASGANLSSRTSPADMYKMALRKIGHYKDEDWKRRNIINLRKATHKTRHQNYLNTAFKVSIFDFPYFMRIRSNYRDFAFIDGIDTSETAQYFKKYFGFTANVVNALEKMEANLTSMRT